MAAALPQLSPVARFHRFTFRFGRRCVTYGFDVRAMLPDRRERGVIFGKLAAALELIANHDHRRFAYLLRDLPSVWVVGPPASIAQCHARLGMCVLDFDYVTSAHTTAGRLAQILVHEGAHARLERAGFGYREEVRPRIERICVRQEAAFARRVPGATQLVVEAEERLGNPDEIFSDRARREREVDALRGLGLLGRLGYRVARAFRRAV